MKKKLVVHIGPHKTGTTAIQKALTANRQSLCENGWLYPEVATLFYGHHTLVEMIKTNNHCAAERVITELIEKNTNIVISSENFSLLKSHHWSYFRGLTQDLVDFSFVFFSRNPIDLLYSNWQENVKHCDTPSFTGYACEHFISPSRSPILNPSICLDELATVLNHGALQIHSYEDACNYKGGIVNYFLERVLCVNLTVNEEPYVDVNRSFDPVDTEIIRMCSPLGEFNYQTALNDKKFKNILKMARAVSHRHMRTLCFNLDEAMLREIEFNTVSKWRNYFSFSPDNNQIYNSRCSEIGYIDSKIWAVEHDLTHELLSYFKFILR